MARTPAPPEDDFTERIVDIDVASEMQTSFLEYAYSVIYSRALPDARDGLKPVQRRILYAMDEMGIRPDRSHVKCARVVGQVMGQLPPARGQRDLRRAGSHRPAVDDAAALVDGHGNFGSLDDGPAAMRYTECRMAPAALAMTDGPGRGHRRLQAQLRRQGHRAGRAAGRVPEPAGQRGDAGSPSAWPPTARRTTWWRWSRPCGT